MIQRVRNLQTLKYYNLDGVFGKTYKDLSTKKDLGRSEKNYEESSPSHEMSSNETKNLIHIHLQIFSLRGNKRKCRWGLWVEVGEWGERWG